MSTSPRRCPSPDRRPSKPAPARTAAADGDLGEERFLDRLESIAELSILEDAPRLTWDHPASSPAPVRPRSAPGLSIVVAHRAQGLGHPEILRTAAVLGAEVELDVLAAVTGAPRQQLRADLHEAHTARMLVTVGQSGWRFISPAVAEALRQDVPEAERRSIHGRAAEYFEGRAVAPGLPCAATVARHLLAAGSSDADRLVRWVVRALDEAGPAAADELGELCTQALAELGSDPSEPRAHLLARLARFRRSAGDESSARALFLAAAETADAAGDAELAADVVVACLPLLELSGSDDTMLRLLESLEQRLPDGSPQRAAIEARLAVVLPAAGTQLRRRKSLVMAASRRAQQARDDGLVGTVLGAWLLTHWGPRAANSRVAAADEMINRARRARDHDLLFAAHRLRRHTLLEQGEGARADAELALAGRLAQARPVPGAAGWLAVMQAGRAVLEGRFADAEGLGAEALSAAGGGPDPAPWIEQLVAQAFVLRRERGELEAIELSLRRLADERPEVQFWRAAHAYALAEAGRTVEARVAVERFLLDGLPTLAADQHWLPTVFVFADVAIRLRVHAGTPALYAALLPWDGKMAVVSHGAAVLGAVGRVLGQLSSLQGAPAMAGHFTRALDTEARLGAGPLAARTKLVYGVALLGGGAADAMLARQLISDAHDAALAYGMKPLAAEAAVRLADPPPEESTTVAVRSGGASPDRQESCLITESLLRVSCFGHYRLERAGQLLDLSAIKPRVRHLLWLLSLHAGGPVHADEIIEALWPESPPDSGRRNLQVAMHSLRRFLEPDASRGDWRALIREGDSYSLLVEEQTDLARFAAAVATARLRLMAGRHQDALSAYEEALACCAGELIPEAGTAEWIVEIRRMRRSEAADAAAAAAELRLAQGDTAAAFNLCEKGIALDRYRDRLWRLLVQACDAARDHAAAARAREGYATVLAELGVEAS